MKATNRHNNKNRHKTMFPKYGTLLKVVIPVFIIMCVLFVKLTTKYWDGYSKISFVYEKGNDVAVSVLDPMLSEETTLIIPGDTEVDVAHGYGTFRIKNVWKLGVNEKLTGKLLAETVTKYFLFPTFYWAETDLSKPWKFVFSPGLTNIPFGDRLSMAIFSMRVKGIDTTEIDLAKNQFLKKQILADGSLGYVMNGPVSGRLLAYFSDNHFSDVAVAGKNLKFGIVDTTGVFGVANKVGSILEVLGGKVVSIDKKPEREDLDCKVYGKNSQAIRISSILFGCSKTEGVSEFDLVIELGTMFAKRF